MTTTSAGTVTEAYEQLAATLRGDVITPSDPQYDQARAVYNAMIDKHPDAIAPCRDVADVIAGVIVGVDPDPANADLISRWARNYWEALHPTSAGGAYVNFLMDEGQDRVRASYRGNYDRLAQIKDRYDPGNTFHINQNIQPASMSTP